MASIMVTSAPSRDQTLPSSRPITPAPTTPMRAGTASNSSAPQESTICSPSNFAMGNSMGVDPEARITFFACKTSTSPETGRNSTLRPAMASEPLRGAIQSM